MTDADLITLFCDWAVWNRSRRHYAPSPHVQSIMGSLVGPRGSSDRPDARLDPFMPYLHMAIRSNAEHALLLHVAHIQRLEPGKRDPIRVVARDLGISRAAFYRRLGTTRRTVYEAAMRMRAAAELPISPRGNKSETD